MQTVDEMLAIDESILASKHAQLLHETIDVAKFVAESIVEFPQVLRQYQQSGKAA